MDNRNKFEMINCDLKTTSAETVALTDSTENEITLVECFKNIVEGNPVEFDIENLNNILRKDLRVNFHYLKPRLKTVIPCMLVHYIKCWPGWHKNNNYVNNQISFNGWFLKFKEYLVFKVNYLIKNDYEKVLTMIKTNNTPNDDLNTIIKIDNSTQINVPTEKPVAPYTIEIRGVPKILNSLIFCEGNSSNDSIMLREYKTNNFAETLTTKQLVNFPNVEVEFCSKELHFTRRNMHEFKRYLMLSNEKITFKKIGTFIEEVEIIDKELSRAAYTLHVLKKYCDTFMEILRKHQILMELTDDYIDDIKIVLEEFIMDIEDLKMNSMATNTSVLFNMGRYIYARNKSVRTSDQAVSFAESITPKSKLSLISFTGINNENYDNPFQGLQNVSNSTDKEFIKDCFLPIVKYTCTFCEVHYEKREYISNHFKEKHCMEQPVLCFMCKLQMDVATICQNRWIHQCKSKNHTTQQ